MAFVDLDRINGAFSTSDHRVEGHQRALAISDELIRELLDADEIIVGTPMCNFAVPAVLKAWIAHVVRIGKTFEYGSAGHGGAHRAPGRQLTITLYYGGSSNPLICQRIGH